MKLVDTRKTWLQQIKATEITGKVTAKRLDLAWNFMACLVLEVGHLVALWLMAAASIGVTCFRLLIGIPNFRTITFEQVDPETRLVRGDLGEEHGRSRRTLD